jgi:hypothetical protein
VSVPGRDVSSEPGGVQQVAADIVITGATSMATPDIPLTSSVHGTGRGCEVLAAWILSPGGCGPPPRGRPSVDQVAMSTYALSDLSPDPQDHGPTRL